MKKIVATLLAIATCFLLCACGLQKEIGNNKEEENNNSNNSIVFEKVAKDEWAEIFNIAQYQSYLMKIVGSETTEDGYSEEIEVTVQFKNPYFKIVSLTTEGCDKSWSNSDEETAFISGGIEELQTTVYIPNNIRSFYETISNLEDFGYSKFLFEEENNTYSSNMFEGFESVEIKITNDKLDSIVLVKEYCDLDWGDTTERFTLNLFDINNTQKPEIAKSEVVNLISQVKNSINKAIKARKYYQSTDYYDVEQAIDTCDDFLNDLVAQHNNLKFFESSKYSWADYEFDEYEEETYHDIILSCSETRSATMFNKNVNYNEIHLSIENGKIVSVELYQNSAVVCPIYFIYE